MTATRFRILAMAGSIALASSACSVTVSANDPVAAPDRTPTTQVAPGTHSSEQPAGSTGADVAPVRLLDMNDVTAAVEGDRNLQVHLTASLGGLGVSMPGVDFVTRTDAANQRFSFVSQPVSIGAPGHSDAMAGPVTIPGYEIIGQRGDSQVDLYVRKAGEASWTHLIVAASVAGEADAFSGPAETLKALDFGAIPGLEFADGGTVAYQGETMHRQVAQVDLAKSLRDIVPDSVPGADGHGAADEFAGALGHFLESEGLGGLLPSGSVEMIVDADELPRKVTVDLTTGSGSGAAADISGSLTSVITIDPLADDATIDLPDAAAVTKTIEIRTSDEFAAALGELRSTLSPN